MLLAVGGWVGLQPVAVRGGAGSAPRIAYATAIDQRSDSVADVAADAAGNLWLVGSTANLAFPITSDAADPVRAMYDDGYVAKLDADGALVYATYLGGSAFNCIGGAAIDEDGNVYLAGTTTSTDFPVSGSAVQSVAPGGAGDGFLAKLDSAGHLLHATYFGGTGYESCPGRGYPVASIALGPGGAVYVVIGSTNSTQFPAGGAERARSDADGLVARFDRDLRPIWGRFIGGSFVDQMTRVATDAAGSVYVTGTVARELGQSHDFPTTPGALQTTTESDLAPVLLKFTPSGDVVYATFLTATRGSSGSRWYPNLAVAADGTAYVAVLTGSPDMPVTPGAFAVAPRGATDAFIFAVQPDGAGLRYGTYLGGSAEEQAHLTLPAIALDDAGQVALGLATLSSDFPLRDAFDTTRPTTSVVAKLAADGRALVYASYLRQGAHALAHRAGALFAGGQNIAPTGSGIGAVKIDETAAACAGDCDGDRTVRVNELVTGVRIALGELATGACAVFDGDGDGTVSIAELIGAVGALLNGCANEIAHQPLTGSPPQR
ncbi:MAG: SBBP repeat-containing protein [Candidatus Binatia bacterium]